VPPPPPAPVPQPPAPPQGASREGSVPAASSPAKPASPGPLPPPAPEPKSASLPPPPAPVKTTPPPPPAAAAPKPPAPPPATAGASIPPPPPPAAPQPPAPAAAAPAKPRNRRLGLAIAGLVVAILIAVAGLWLWLGNRDDLAESTVLAALDAQLGAGKVHFTTVALEPVSASAQERVLKFKANGTLATDLFVRNDTIALLREKYPDRFARLETLATEFDTPANVRLAELAKLGRPPADPRTLVLLEKTATAGATLAATGQFTATRGPDGWKLEIATEDFTPALPLGKPRANHPASALLVADPAFATALDRAVADRLAFAGKLEDARLQMAEQIRQERDARQAALLVALQPGALFLGRAEPLALGTESAPGLVLEVASSKDGARQLTALLRNKGDWTDTRTFAGTWETDADFTSLSLQLSTRESQSIPDAGPLLATSAAWTIALTLDPEGHLVGQSPTHKYTFARVASGELERTRAELAAAHEAAVSATRPGTVYRGTVTAKANGAATPAFLRFTRQDNNGIRIEAEIELADRPGRTRTFRGYIAANPHRTGDRPLRLASESRRRNSRTDNSSVTGLAFDLAPAFAIKGAALSGIDEYFEYEFAPLSTTELGQIDATRRSAQTGLLAIVKAGSTYDGTARHRDGFDTALRLRFTRVEDDGTVGAVVESLKRPGISVRLAGTIDFTARTLQLASTGSRPDTGSDLRVPFLVQNAKYTLDLALAEDSIGGTIEHDTDWTLRFALRGGAISAPAELPPWPAAGGAYVLASNSWQPLPANNGHPVNSRSSKKDGPVKVAELVFDGKAPVPAIPLISPVVIAYVGAVTPPSADLVAKYPEELTGYPGVELAPARKALVGGKRTADLFRVTPEIAGFQTARIAATLSEPADGITLLIANTPLQPGCYALLANGNAFELQVK
jgi:hypothetical protein